MFRLRGGQDRPDEVIVRQSPSPAESAQPPVGLQSQPPFQPVPPARIGRCLHLSPFTERAGHKRRRSANLNGDARH